MILILFNAIIQVLTFPDRDRFQLTPRAILQAICRVAGTDRLPVGLAAIDDSTIRSAMALERLVEEALCRSEIPMLAKKELDRIANAIDGAVEIHPLVKSSGSRPFSSRIPVCRRLAHYSSSDQEAFVVERQFPAEYTGWVVQKCELTVFDGEATLAACSKAGGKTMDEPDRWRHMTTAPKDGSRILVTIRPSEQGPAEVDLAYWSNGDQFGAEGWRASDSSPGRLVEYAEPELKCWMPMPSANLNSTSMPSPWEGDDVQQLDGSGI